jgi:hypothetical protein
VDPDAAGVEAALADACGDGDGVVTGTHAVTSARTARKGAALTWSS